MALEETPEHPETLFALWSESAVSCACKVVPQLAVFLFAPFCVGVDSAVLVDGILCVSAEKLAENGHAYQKRRGYS